MTRIISGEKVVLEAMATGRPVIVSNPAFDQVLSRLPPWCRFSEGNAEELDDGIVEFFRTSRKIRSEIGRELRRCVGSGHSLARSAESIVSWWLEGRPRVAGVVLGGLDEKHP